MNEFATAIIAIAGTLLGGAVAFFAQSRVSAHQIAEARHDRRRDDFVGAASEFAAAATMLLQAEYNRAKQNIGKDSDAANEDAKQATYDRRSDAQLAKFRLQIICRPQEDHSLIESAQQVIESCKALSEDPATLAELNKQHRAAKVALSELIGELNERADALYRSMRKEHIPRR